MPDSFKERLSAAGETVIKKQERGLPPADPVPFILQEKRSIPFWEGFPLTMIFFAVVGKSYEKACKNVLPE